MISLKKILSEATLTEKKYYITYNRGRGQGKDLEKEFDQKTFKTTNKPKVFNSYNDAKKYAEKMEKMFRNSIGGGTAYWVSDEKMNPIKEAVNEAAMNPVKKVVNAILKKHNVQAMKTYASSVRGAHNIINGGYRWEGDWHLGFYGNVPQDVVEKVAAEMEKAGVKYVKVKKGHISADFSKTGLSEDWSQKYKNSINCSNPKGFSQKAHCAGKNENMKLTVEQKMELFLEKNVPNDSEKWSYAKSQAKQKFDVYPSAYANGWAAKKYKELGGTWKSAD